MNSDVLLNLVIYTSGSVLFIFLSLVTISYFLAHIQSRVSASIYRVGGKKALILIQFPGIMLHEISHAFLCLVFFHKIDSICLYKPDFITGNLGYVNHSWNRRNIFQEIGNVFIGMAPIIVGPIVLCFILQSFFPSLSQLPTDVGEFVSVTSLIPSKELSFGPEMCILLFLAASISLHTAPSKTDIKQSFLSLLSLVIVVCLLIIVCALIYGYGINAEASIYIDKAFRKLKTLLYIQFKMILIATIFSIFTLIVVTVLQLLIKAIKSFIYRD